MRNIIILLTLVLFSSCDDCGEIVPKGCGEPIVLNSEFCGWTVVTCFGEKGNDPVAALFDSRYNDFAPIGDDWGITIQSIHPVKWNLNSLGQVFGITIDDNDNIYLASSDVYHFDNKTKFPSGNISRPYPCGQIFKCSPPNWIPTPFANLPNSCGAGNGIGNIKYDKWNDQFFASNLEDGKIYRIKKDGSILDSYDVFNADDGKNGIAPNNELVWGLSIGNVNGVVKLYFPLIKTNSRNLYSIELNNGNFPTAKNAEKIEFANLSGSSLKYTDVAISQDGVKLILAERGDPHKCSAISLEISNGVVASTNYKYYTGGFTGENSAGGVDFFNRSKNKNRSFQCDEMIWVTGNYMMAKNIGFSNNKTIYGIQGINYLGNSILDANLSNSNSHTDLYVDLDGIYGPQVKGGIGDVEVFDCTECVDPCTLTKIVKK